MSSLPPSISRLLTGGSFQKDAIGKSGSTVLLFSDKVLKIQPDSDDARREYALLRWLQGKLPVPEILAWEIFEGRVFLLMTRVPGEMACSQVYMTDPACQVKLLAQALKALWQVDTAGCPVNCRLPQKLTAARRQVELGLVDVEDTQPGTFGEGGFSSPMELLTWLEEHQPEEDLGFTHGDFCLPNVFFSGEQISGFLDLGRGGIGDKWNDIALCYRSLAHNYSGLYDGKVYPGYDPLLLFQELDMEPDWEKLRYYILLDELF